MSLHETVISFTSLYKYRERVKEKSSNILFVIVIHCLKTLQDSSHSTAFCYKPSIKITLEKIIQRKI
jgi:hypothetical protein